MNAFDSAERRPRQVLCPPLRRRPLTANQDSGWPPQPQLSVHAAFLSISASRRRHRLRTSDRPAEQQPSHRSASCPRRRLSSHFSRSARRSPSHDYRPTCGQLNYCRRRLPQLAVRVRRRSSKRTGTWAQRSGRKKKWWQSSCQLLKLNFREERHTGHHNAD